MKKIYESLLLFMGYLLPNKDLESFNEFIKNHTQEIHRLSKKDNLSCMGI